MLITVHIPNDEDIPVDDKVYVNWPFLIAVGVWITIEFAGGWAVWHFCRSKGWL